ncbi:hypothetical protein [Saccharicrinis sp. GN24d3]|uniref:hypothetical protein n=1 Tax=Saccharicrinis sp. GN24d3 TaxID=3458416 RepID=UPI004036293E
MKSLKESQCYWRVMAIFILIAFIATNCNDPAVDDPILDIQEEETASLDDLLAQIDPLKDMVIVPNDGSIQEAHDAIIAEGTIFVEPGTYSETLDTKGKTVQMIALSNNADQVAFNNPEQTEIQSLSGDQLKRGRKNRIKMTRENLGGGIAHYKFEVNIGNGEYDMVRIHRVVKEHRPYRPIKTKGNIFMVHGAIQNFDDIFLTAGAENPDATTSAPIYLATNKIDVWGIDLGWTEVPIETTDFSFMEVWGVEKDVDHTLKAMTIARLIRGFTGQSFCKMNLLGFSYGVMVAYGGANRETQTHRICRNIKGIIPVDSPFKLNPADPIAMAIHEIAYSNAEKNIAKLNSGIYSRGDDYGPFIINVSSLAYYEPDEPSAIFSAFGFTNSQAAKFIFSMASEPDYWHFYAGDKDSFLYTDPIRSFRLGVNLSPYMPLLMTYEMSSVKCDYYDVSFDDHLSEIKVPILYIGAGSAGTLGEYTPTLTSSSDISNLIVTIPGAEPATDYGHADLWLGYDAHKLVWEPLYQWLLEH